MGNQTGRIRIKNQTPYKWTVCLDFYDLGIRRGMEFVHLNANQEKMFNWTIQLSSWEPYYITVKYGHCSDGDCRDHSDLWYKFSLGDGPTFTIRESGDRSDIHLDCDRHYDNKKPTCPNYGKEEDDARQRQEEQRREREREQAQRERERRIEEQIKRESEITANKLSLANESLKQKQLLRGQESQQIQIMQEPMEIYVIDETAGIEEKFTELLSIYNIYENEDPGESLAKRIKCLQDEIMVKYCKTHDLTSSCIFNFDAAVGHETLSLSDKLAVLEAVLYIALEEDVENGTPQRDQDFILQVLEQLHNTHPSVALNLLENVLYTDVELSMQSKDILYHMIYSNVWTPEDTTDFIHNISGRDKKQVYAILHMAQTYKLQYCTVKAALQKQESLRCLQRHVNNEKHKDAETILKEMRNAEVPENVLTVLEDVLVFLEKELPKHETTTLSEREIEDLKTMIELLDFRNPDTAVLKRVLIGISVAVKSSSTISIEHGEKTTTIVGYLPRLTQLAALLTFLLPKSKTNTGCLLEIGTGEGKSCILAMLAAVHAIRGEKVDLVTSSPVLAYRDSEEWKKLYTMFGITSSVVPPPLNDAKPEQKEELIREAYKQQIVYSTVGTLAADILRQEFEKKITRGERSFDLVVVDEVDYMTLDNGVQITFLSHESSGLQHLEQIFASIWATTSACRPIQMAETGEIMWTSRVQNFHKAALLAMIGSETSDQFPPLELLLPGIELGFYSDEEFEMLKESVSAGDDGKDEHWKTVMDKTGVEQQYDLLSVLEIGMENKVAFNCYAYQTETRTAIPFGEKKTETDQNVNMLLLDEGKACEIMSEELLLEAIVQEMKSRIKYSNQSLSRTEPSLNPEKNTLMIPSFLEEYLKKQLPVFAENALKAIQMTKGREYMIEMSFRAQGMNTVDEEQHMYHSIIPLDFQASGVLEKQKRWGDGLQQFLEMKHQLALSTSTNVTNYMSNLSFFKRYLSGKGILGVSGTLGGDADKSFLERHYKTDSYVIPAHQRKKVTELPAVQVRGGTDEWIQTLCDTVSEVSERGQVVLVVCEDVNTANTLNEKITARTKHRVTLYTMSGRHSIENKEFTKGEIIITTNLGGRGTDIKVTAEVNQLGGLFVMLTYFPSNRRVKQQVFGRTGRKGTPGMVQLILNHNRLAQAYQGTSIEVMRELREEHEMNRIIDMEKERLVEIAMKEELFSEFCKFLIDFDKYYTTEEKTDLFEVKAKGIPRYFESSGTKMDYHPALNALKEAWGMWLILHSDQINTQNDIGKLKSDLIQHLQNTRNSLLQGNSANVCDHIQQAVGRTALHFKNRKCDYGAKDYWEKASNSDNCYRAAALYNQAYIAINMGKKNYKNEACTLLKEAERAMGVYISETANTLSLVSLSVTGDFQPHHSEACNFQTQMQARMNIFNAWKKNITKILDVLKPDGEDVITQDCSLYGLLDYENFVTASELSLFRNYGLAVVFDVKLKPKFCFDALICCFIGVIQVVAGVLVCALSSGSMSSFGLGLISEGVSDMISGITGMINGAFDWASWAISKAISIGISLVFGGFRVLKSAFSSVKNAVKGIYNGTKSLSSVARGAVQSGKQMFMSACKTVKSAMSIKTLSTLCTSNVAKTTLKQASKYAVQELAIQGVNTAVNKGIDMGVQETFKLAFHRTFRNSVHSALKNNKDFTNAVTEFISSAVPKNALEGGPGKFKIDKHLETKIRENVNLKMNVTISNLMLNCEEIHQVINALSQVWDRAVQDIDKKISGAGQQGNKKIMFFKYGVKASLSLSNLSVQIAELCSAIPTEATINGKFVPAFLKSLNEEKLFEKYDADGRHRLEDVARLTQELISLISEGVAQIMIADFSGSATSIFTSTFTQKLNSVTGKVVGNVLGRHETKDFFDNQKHFHDLKSAKARTGKPLTETEEKEVAAFVNHAVNEQSPATALDLHVLTQSGLVKGKGICVTVVDAKGKLLSEENYPGTDVAAGTIKLVLTKTPETQENSGGFLNKLINKVTGKQTAHSGHFDIIRPDGSREAVNSENQNCLFHAIAQATSGNSDREVIKQKVTELRSRVSVEVQSKPDKYVKAVKIQSMFNETNQYNKFKIEGGVSQDDIDKYKKMTNGMNDASIISQYKLGKVGEYESLKEEEKLSKAITHADHIPSLSSLREAWRRLKGDKDAADKLSKKNPKLFEHIRKMEDDNEGKMQLCINVPCFDHIQALSSNNTREGRVCRSLQVEALLSGDVERSVKLSLLSAHPQSSDSIRKDSGIGREYKHQECRLSETSRNGYYKDGFEKMVDKLTSIGILNQNQRSRLKDWVKNDQFLSSNTKEYKDIVSGIKSEMNKEPNKKRPRE